MFNKVYNLYNSIPSSYSDSGLIDSLITFLSNNPKIDNTLLNFLYKNTKDNPIDLLHLIGLINQKNKEKEKIGNTDKRKHFGIYYTDYSIARKLAQDAVDKISNKDLTKITFWEPCAGVGVFIIAFIDEIVSRIKKISTEELQRIINNIYYSDIDGDAIKIINKFLPLYIKNKYKKDIKINNKNYYIGDVLFDIDKNQIKKKNINDIFEGKNGFDVILTNPPYKLLKANIDKYNDEAGNKYFEEINVLLKYIRENRIYKYNEGTLNLYKIFLEEILENYSNTYGIVGFLIPITLLNDQQSKLLRQRIFNNYCVTKIYTISEKNEFFPDISQAFTFFVVDKVNKTKIIEMINNVNSCSQLNKKGVLIDVENLKNISESSPIIIENEIGLDVLKKISKNKKIKNFESIINSRGELDLTFYKNFITREKTSLPLIRGANIEEFKIKNIDYFVKEEFLQKIGSKNGHTKITRIACQQISNINSKKRLKFAIVEKNYILGNSCNYITIQNDLFGLGKKLSLEYLLGVLNSDLLNWRFKLTNSNNHVSNYEIYELPIAVPTNEQKGKIETIVKNIISEENNEKNLLDNLNNLVFDIYNLNEKEKAYISNQ